MTKSKPLVSIQCLVYNHEAYLKECLEGFVSQRVNFPFEAIVHDDASTDNSASIIREYAKRYPDIIKPIIESENQYKKQDGSIERIMLAACEGKYIAMCEGDDYWTDPFKLQKEVDLLETNSLISLVYSNFETIDDVGNKIQRDDYEMHKKRSKTGSVFFELIKGNFVMTLTTCMRREVFENPLFRNSPTKFDYAVFLTASTMGLLAYLPEKTACYRQSPNGMMSTKRKKINEALLGIRLYFIQKYLEGCFVIDDGRTLDQHLNIIANIVFNKDVPLKKKLPLLLKKPKMIFYAFSKLLDKTVRVGE